MAAEAAPVTRATASCQSAERADRLLRLPPESQSAWAAAAKLRGVRVPAVSGRGRRVRGFGGAVFGVDAQGLFELVFEDDDAAGGLDGGPGVGQLPGAGRDPELVAGV